MRTFVGHIQLLMKTAAVLLLLLAFASSAIAQNFTWHQTKGPFGAGSYQYVGASNGGVVLATDKHVYASVDGGLKWEANSDGLPTSSYLVSAGIHGRIFATSKNLLYLQNSIKGSWTNLPLPDTITSLLTSVVEDSIGGILVNQIGAMPFYSTDNGQSWHVLNFADSTYQVQDMAATSDHSIYLLTFGGNVFRSADGGVSWIKKWSIIRDPVRSRIISKGNTIYVFGRNSACSFSIDQGSTWKRMSVTLPDSAISGFTITPKGSWIVNVVSSKAIYRPTLGNYRSTDQGQTWDSLGMIGRDLVADSSGVLYIANYRSTDDGFNWQPMTLDGVRDRAPIAITEDSTNEVMFSMPNMGLFVTSDNGGSFTLRALRAITCLANSPDGTLYGGARGIYFSSDRGRNWRHDSTNVHLLVSTCLSLIRANTGTFYTGCAEGIVYGYHPGDTAWDGPHGLIDQVPVPAMAANRKGRPFAILATGMFRLDTILGVWQQITLNANSAFKALAVDSSDRLLVSTQDGRLYTSADDGDNWDSIPVGLPKGSYISQLLITPDSSLYAGCTADSGTKQGILHWNRVLSKWELRNKGLITPDHSDIPAISLLSYAGGHLFAVTTDRGAFVSGGPEGVSTRSIEAAALSVMPNPLRDNAIVSFSLNGDSYVRMGLMDLLGRKVLDLANRFYSAGGHSIQLNTTAPSGVYVLHMQTDAGVSNSRVTITR